MNPKLVYLEWADAYTNPNWMSGDEVRHWADDDEWIVREAGWVIRETKEYIVFASSFKPQTELTDERFCNLHKIPKTWIRRRVDLTKRLPKYSPTQGSSNQLT